MRIKVIKGKITSVLFDSSYTPNPFKSIVTRFLKEAPTIPLTSKQICPFENDGYYLQLCYSKSIDSAKFSERFQQKYTQYRKKAIAEIDPDELNYYIISSSQLGWINCDRFIDLKEEKIDYLVQVPQGNNTQLQLVFGDIKSVMQGEQKGNGFIFRNVPLNRKVTLMAISYLNKRPSLCHAQTFISKTPYQLKDFKEFTLSELELALKKL